MDEKYVKLNDVIDTLEHEWGYEGMREDLEKLPTADVAEVNHGFWKKEKLVMCEPYYLCSICGKLHDQEYLYCNECGAKMDGTPKEKGGEKC